MHKIMTRDAVSRKQVIRFMVSQARRQRNKNPCTLKYYMMGNSVGERMQRRMEMWEMKPTSFDCILEF